MARGTGIGGSRLLAGLQIIFGYYSVAEPSPEPIPAGPVLSADGRPQPKRPAAPTQADLTFAVQPPNIRNDIWVVFRGTRDQHTGTLAGEIVPDFQMRFLGLVPCAAFAVAGAVATTTFVVAPLVTGGRPSLIALAWSALAAFLVAGWARSCGAAVHEAAQNVRRDSPGADLAWHPGIRYGTRSTSVPPPPSTVVPVMASGPAWTDPEGPGSPETQTSRPSRSHWLGLLGLAVPLLVAWLFVLPLFTSRNDRAEWVSIDGVVGAEVDPDHATVTYVLPDGTEKTSTVPVMRTAEEGDVIDLHYPPGRPDLIEQDRSGFVLPYFIFGGFAIVASAVVIGQFLVARRRARESAARPI